MLPTQNGGLKITACKNLTKITGLVSKLVYLRSDKDNATDTGCGSGAIESKCLYNKQSISGVGGIRRYNNEGAAEAAGDKNEPRRSLLSTLGSGLFLLAWNSSNRKTFPHLLMRATF